MQNNQIENELESISQFSQFSEIKINFIPETQRLLQNYLENKQKVDSDQLQMDINQLIEQQSKKNESISTHRKDHSVLKELLEESQLTWELVRCINKENKKIGDVKKEEFYEFIKSHYKFECQSGVSVNQERKEFLYFDQYLSDLQLCSDIIECNPVLSQLHSLQSWLQQLANYHSYYFVDEKQVQAQSQSYFPIFSQDIDSLVQNSKQDLHSYNHLQYLFQKGFYLLKCGRYGDAQRMFDENQLGFISAFIEDSLPFHDYFLEDVQYTGQLSQDYLKYPIIQTKDYNKSVSAKQNHYQQQQQQPYQNQIGNPNWLSSLKQLNNKCNDNQGLVNQKGIYSLLSFNLNSLLQLGANFHDKFQAYLSCYYFHQVVRRLIFIKHCYQHQINQLNHQQIDFEANDFTAIYNNIFGHNVLEDDVLQFMKSLNNKLDIKSQNFFYQIQFEIIQHSIANIQGQDNSLSFINRIFSIAQDLLNLSSFNFDYKNTFMQFITQLIIIYCNRFGYSGELQQKSELIIELYIQFLIKHKKHEECLIYIKHLRNTDKIVETISSIIIQLEPKNKSSGDEEYVNIIMRKIKDDFNELNIIIQEKVFQMSQLMKDQQKQLQSIGYLFEDQKYDASLNLLLKLIRELLFEEKNVKECREILENEQVGEYMKQCKEQSLLKELEGILQLIQISVIHYTFQNQLAHHPVYQEQLNIKLQAIFQLLFNPNLLQPFILIDIQNINTINIDQQRFNQLITIQQTYFYLFLNHYFHLLSYSNSNNTITLINNLLFQINSLTVQKLLNQEQRQSIVLKINDIMISNYQVVSQSLNNNNI